MNKQEPLRIQPITRNDAGVILTLDPGGERLHVGLAFTDSYGAEYAVGLQPDDVVRLWQDLARVVNADRETVIGWIRQLREQAARNG